MAPPLSTSSPSLPRIILPAPASAPSLPAVRVPRLDVRLILALAAVYVVWGSTYYAMHVAVATLPPLLMGGMRFVLAGVVLLTIATLRGAPLPTARHWLYAVPIGVLYFVGGNGLVAIALTTIDSGVAAVVCATMPLWMAVATSLSGERASGREWLGLVVGFAGVVVLVGGASTGGDLLHLVLLILSPLAWAVGSILARRLPLPSGLGAAGLQMTTGGLALGGLGLALGERIPLDAPASGWLALLYLMVFGSLVAFSAFAWLIRNTRPALATSYAFVNPVIAVLLGAALGGEALGLSTVAATALIVGAVALVVTGKGR